MMRIWRRARFEPTQKCAPIPKAMCGVRVALDVEILGVDEDVLIAIGRWIHDHDALVFSDGLSAKLHVAGRCALHVEDR